MNDFSSARTWLDALRNKDGKIPGNETTLARAIETCPEIGDAIAYDTRRGRIVAQRAGPWGEAGPWTDAMTACLLIYLQDLGIPARLRNLETALATIAKEIRVDPFGDWLAGLQWDGTKRLGDGDTPGWLTTYAGAPDTPVVRLIGAKFLIGMMARAKEPGMQMDYALVLEGPQGAGKSTLARILGGEYFAGDLPDFSSRDSQMIAASFLVVEIAELAAVGRSSLEKFKSFMTQCSDTYVPKWGRHAVTRPRWCTFILTVNPDGSGYLVDSTGQRRLWPIAIRTLKAAELRENRENLFAEALDRLNKGAAWWPEGEAEWAQLKDEQDEREVEDPWQPIIAAWLENSETGWPRFSTDNPARLLTTDIIAHHALRIPFPDISKGTAKRIGILMKPLGYSRRQSRSGGRRTWYYEMSGDSGDSGDT
jgi:predicted P-loop ATPase